MPRIRFSHRAQADLAAINRHTIETWGREQATAYIDGLELTAKKRAAAPEIGKSRDDLARRLRAFPYQSRSGRVPAAYADAGTGEGKLRLCR